MPQQQSEVRLLEPSTSIQHGFRDLLRYRELLVNLVRKELRVTYKNSVLGFVWSMLNPALYLVIFWIVFTYFLGANIPSFPIYLLSGLLGWNLWSASLGGSVNSLIGNANLVTKVFFPREILPLSVIGASLMHFFFQFAVLVLALIAFRFPVGPEAILLVPTSLAVLLLLAVGVSLIVAVLNVYFRDVQHLLELVLLAWFWMTPIVYPSAFVADKGETLFSLYMLNPMTTIVMGFQRGVYGFREGVLVEPSIVWYLRNLGIVAILAVVLITAGWWIFRRLESRLAEEL